jgi:hypothetical protein
VLPAGVGGCGDGGERGGSGGGVVADVFDVQQTPVGGEADLPQCGEVRQPFTQVEVAGVVDGGLGAQGAAQLATAASRLPDAPAVLNSSNRQVLDVLMERDGTVRPLKSPAGTNDH